MESAQTLSSGSAVSAGVGAAWEREGGAQRFVGDRAVRDEAPDLGEREFVAALPIVARVVQALERHGVRRSSDCATHKLASVSAEDQSILLDAVEFQATLALNPPPTRALLPR